MDFAVPLSQLLPLLPSFTSNKQSKTKILENAESLVTWKGREWGAGASPSPPWTTTSAPKARERMCPEDTSQRPERLPGRRRALLPLDTYSYSRLAELPLVPMREEGKEDWGEKVGRKSEWS